VWLLRDLLRLVALVALGVLLGCAGGEIWHMNHSGDFVRAARGGLVVVAGLTLLLAAAPGMTLDGRVTSRVTLFGPMLQAAPTGPRINPTALFIGAGVALLAIGVVL
jgi:hypothetical protein